MEIYYETGNNQGKSKHGELDVCVFAEFPSFNREKTILSIWSFM